MTYLSDEQKRELREWATSDACCRPSRFLSIASDVLALLDEIEALKAGRIVATGEIDGLPWVVRDGIRSAPAADPKGDVGAAAIDYSVRIHGDGPEFQPDRWYAVDAFRAGVRFARGGKA